jgi:hypothetical protein
VQRPDCGARTQNPCHGYEPLLSTVPCCGTGARTSRLSYRSINLALAEPALVTVVPTS